MTATDIRMILEEFGIHFTHDPHGFTFYHFTNDLAYGSSEWWNLSSGGGIAGNLGAWHLRLMPNSDGVKHTPKGPFRTKTALRRAMRELMAGPKPAEQPGYRLYAKLNHNRYGDFYVWCHQRVQG